MEFRLVKASVLDLHLTGAGVDARDDLRYSPAYRDDQPRSFAVIFDVRAVLPPIGAMALKYLAIFETTEEITDEFRNSNFPRVNAPAVAYPYVRAFVAQFSSLIGAELYTLPIRNFHIPQIPTQQPALAPQASTPDL